MAEEDEENEDEGWDYERCDGKKRRKRELWNQGNHFMGGCMKVTRRRPRWLCPLDLQISEPLWGMGEGEVFNAT